jgi:hypothetical protein
MVGIHNSLSKVCGCHVYFTADVAPYRAIAAPNDELGAAIAVRTERSSKLKTLNCLTVKHLLPLLGYAVAALALRVCMLAMMGSKGEPLKTVARELLMLSRSAIASGAMADDSSVSIVVSPRVSMA